MTPIVAANGSLTCLVLKDGLITPYAISASPKSAAEVCRDLMGGGLDKFGR